MIRDEQGLNIRLAFKPGIDLAQMLLERRAHDGGIRAFLEGPAPAHHGILRGQHLGQGTLHEDNAVLVSAGESEQKA